VVSAVSLLSSWAPAFANNLGGVDSEELQSKESKNLTYHAGNRKLLSTSRHSVKVQWWQDIMISS
jgi:hypothetical protein